MTEKLASFRAKFNRQFDYYLFEKEKELVAIDSSIKPLVSHARKIAKKGKRIRAFLADLSFMGFGGKDEKLVLQAGISLELLHLFALIHDDIIDKDEERRGIMTVHKKFGLDSGILAGDLILTLADEAFPFSKKALNCYHQLKKEVIVGQYLDVLSEQKEESILKTMELKTARYTVFRPLQIGALLAGAGQSAIEELKKYALLTGIAFQLGDDLLDENKKEVNLVSLKGRKYCQEKLKRLLEDAKKSLKDVRIREEEKAILIQITDYFGKRKK